MLRHRLWLTERALSFVGRQLQPNEKSLVMRADRAFSGGLLPRKHMPAIQTHPTGFHIADKKLIFPKEPGKSLKSLRMNLFDLRDLLEMRA